MKIGIDIRNIGKKRTGDEAVFFNLVKNLAEEDKDNEYLLFTDITERVVVDSQIVNPLNIENKHNFQVVSLKSANKFSWNAWSLPRYLKNNPLEIYHTQYITPFFVSPKIKIVTTVHDLSFNFYPKMIKFLDLVFLKTLIPLSLKRADKIIAVSNFTKKEIVNFYGIGENKVEVVYNAVGSEFANLEYTDGEIFNIRKKYNLPPKYILYLGTMQPRKNIPFLIKAYAELRKEIKDVKLVIAGHKSRNYDRKIDETIKKYRLEDEIVFTGYVSEKDKAAVYRMSSVFASASFYEGFGIPLIEAMSQKVPVLASDIEAHRETAGDAALFFEPRSVDSLVKILYNVLIDENLRQTMIVKGLARSDFFSWKRSAQKLVSIYRNLSTHNN